MIGNIFNQIFVVPTLNALLFFYHAFINLSIPFAFGFAIISLVTAIRIVLNPLYKKQTSFQKKMNDLKPHLDDLQTKHSSDKKKLQEAQMALYKEHNFNPASGCISGILQFPVMIGLYNVMNLFLAENGLNNLQETVNKLVYHPLLKVSQIDPNFFGLNLSLAPSSFQTSGIIYLSIPIITAILQYIQISKSMPSTKKPTTGPKKDDMQSAMNSQMKIMFPLMIGFASYNFAIGLSLYWNLMSVFGILSLPKKEKPLVK